MCDGSGHVPVQGLLSENDKDAGNAQELSMSKDPSGTRRSFPDKT